MTSLDDRILGHKSQNYVSSSESEDETGRGDDGATSAEVDVQSSTFRSSLPKVALNFNIYIDTPGVLRCE